MTMDEGGGLVFGGGVGRDGVDFGEGWFPPSYTSIVGSNGYIVSLDAGGALRFAKRLYAGGPQALSAAGSIVAYAETRWTPGTSYIQLFVYDLHGTELQSGYLALLDDAAGSVDDMLVASDGRVVLNARLKFHPSAAVESMPILSTLAFP